MKKILLPIITLLLIGLTLVSCDLLGEIKKLICLDVSVSSTDYEFSVGEDIKKHLTVKGIYSDGSEKTITKYFTNLTEDKVTSDTKFVTVTYQSKTKTIPINLKTVKTLYSLDVKVTPTNYIFSKEDNVKEHLIVNGIYSDGSEQIISNTDYSTDLTNDKITSTTNSVTVTYEGKSDTVQIFVRDDSKTLYFIDVTVSPTDYKFSVGDNVKEHLIIEGYYSNGTVETISNTDYSTDIDTVTSTTDKVTVTYQSKTKTIPINVRKTLKEIEVITNTDVFFEGQSIKDFITVQSIYSDDTKKIVTDYTVTPTDITSTTNSIEVSYTEGGITQSKTISIINKSFVDIEVITNTDFFFEGENVKDFITVKTVCSDDSKFVIPKNRYTVSPNEIVTSTTDIVTVSFTVNGVEKKKDVDITLGHRIDKNWFNNFSGTDKTTVKSISFVTEEPTVGTKVTEGGGLSYFQNGSDLYVVGRKLIFDTDCSEMFKEFSKVEQIDLTNVDTSNVSNMSNMFSNCGKGGTTVKINSTYKDFFNNTELGTLSQWNYSDSSSTYTYRTLISLDVTSDKYVFEEGEVITSYLTVKGLYSDGSEQTVTDYSTDLIDNKVSSTTNSVTVSYTESDVTKTKTIPISVRSSGNEITLNAIEVTINTDKLYEGDNIKDYLTVKGFYTNSFERIVPKEDYSTDLIGDKVTSTTYSVTVTYTDGGVEKTKSIDIPILGNLSDYKISKDWFSNFSGISKDSVTSISFVKEIPSDVTDSDLVNTTDKFSYYKKGTDTYDLYVVGERIVFPSDSSKMFCEFNYVTEINLSTVNTSKVTDMSYMFENCGNIKSLDLSNFDTSNVTNMSHMFDYCSQLTSLDLSNFNTSNVTDMSSMFDRCDIKSLDLSNFDTSNVTNMSSMFSNCRIESLDLSKFDTSNVTDMSYMFNSCMDLKSLNISKFDTSKVTNMEEMFNWCMDLTSLDLSSFDIKTMTDDRPSVSTNDMFSYCDKLTSVIINPTNKDKFETVLGGGWTYSEPTYTKN